MEKKINKKIFWDYDVEKMDLNNPKTKIWYLNRRLQFGDLSGLTKTDLKKYLPKLDINPFLKELLTNYLKTHVPAIEKKFSLPEFSLQVDSLTDIMVNKTLSTYQRNEPKDVFDIYCYLVSKPKYDLPELIKLVERKFGVDIEPTILLAKINELTSQFNSLSPLLLVPQKELTQKVKKFFQGIFNSIVKKQIK